MRSARPTPTRGDRPGLLLDWRFLLPDTRLGRIGVVGDAPADREPMLAALRAEADTVSDAAAGASLSGVVVFGTAPANLRRARAALEDGGWVYAEAGALRRPRGVDGLRRALEGAGFAGVRVRWHWPSFAEADEVNPLDAPSALAAALRRRRRAGLRALAYRGLSLLARTPLLGVLAPHVSAVATAGEPRQPLVDALVGEHRDRLGLEGTDRDEPAVGYLTPRYGTSRNVIALVRQAGRRRMLAAAKLPRDGNATALRAEADALGLVERHAPTLGPVPRVVVLSEQPGRIALVETAVPGRVIDRRDLLGDRSGWVERVAAWTASLTGLPDATGAPSIAEGLAATAEILDRHAEVDAEMAATAARSRGLLAPLAEVATPIVLEHGDLAPPNLLVARSGALGVVDWELAGPSRFPLHDLAFFLTHVAWEERVASSEERLDAVRAALLDRDGWGARQLERALAGIGLDLALAPTVLLAAWARTAARTLERVAWSGEAVDGSAGLDVARVRELRALAVWRMGVDHLAGTARP